MTQPGFFFEKKLWKKGYKYVIGIDEVGRGAFAGPVVVGAVVFPDEKTGRIGGINDSKLLKPKIREQLAKKIKEKALAWDVTEVGVNVINRLGIKKATEKAMRKSIKDIIEKLGLKLRHESNLSLFILVDYYYIPYLAGVGKNSQLGIKYGDKRSVSIASASILAKVYRDKMMYSLGRKYPQYGWGRNKGYGTKLHQKAILKYGITRYHRRVFIENWKGKIKNR